MPLDLLSRTEAGAPITSTQYDSTITALEAFVNALEDGSGILADAITNVKLANMAQATIKGRASGAGTGDPTDLTAAQLRTILETTIQYLVKTDLAVGTITAAPAALNLSGGSTGHVLTKQANGNLQLQAQAGGGDMSAATYDPTAIAANVFARANHTGTQSVSTITEFNLTGPENNDVLAWDTASGKVLYQNPAEAGLSPALTPNTFTPRASGNISLAGGADGDVLTVQGDGSVAFETVGSSHPHTLADISDAGSLAAQSIVTSAFIQTGAVGPTQLADTDVVPGSYTAANITVDQDGRITAASSGTTDALVTTNDASTAINVGNAITGTHRRLTAGTTITLTLDAQASSGTRVAFTPKGAGSVTVVVEGGATYKLPLDTAGRTASFTLTGYGYFECVANSGGSAAEWDFIGESNHADTADNDIDFADKVISRAELKDIAESYLDAGNKTGAASFDYTAGGWQKCVATGNITSMAVTNPPSTGRVGSLTLEIHQDGTGNRTIAWGAAFRFPGGTDSTLSTAASAIDIFTLITRDGGTTWYVFEGGKAWAA